MDTSPVASLSPSVCFDAQTVPYEYGNGPLNEDLGAAPAGLANIVLNLLLPILVGWSDEVSASVFLLLSQTLPVLVATLSSIKRDNLSLFDAHFSTAVTASPMSVYVAAACCLRLFGVEMALFRKIATKETKNLIMGLGITIPLLWICVSFVTSFSTTAFRNSALCAGMTLPRFLEFVAVSSFTGVLDVFGRRDLYDDLSKRGGLGLVSLLGLWVWGIYLTRHREEIVRKCRDTLHEDLMGKMEGRDLDKRRSNFRAYRQYFLLGWNLPKICWETIIEHHPAMLVLFLLCLHWSWSFGISRALTFDRHVTYGQVLSLAAPIPGLYSFAQIFCQKRKPIFRFFKNLPVYILEGFYFIITGKKTWKEPDQEYRERDYMTWSRLRWTLMGLGWFLTTGLHAVWMTFYVRGGTLPNQRIPVNSPHRNWKIYMYANGYIVSVINIFMSVALYDHYRVCHPNPNRIRHFFGLAIALPLALFFSAGPLFSPYAALPLAQQYQWTHQCDPYPTEVVMTGQSNPGQPSIISFYTAPSDQYQYDHPSEREHVYDYIFHHISPRYRVLEFRRLPNPSLPHDLIPPVEALVFDIDQKRFFSPCSPIDSRALLPNSTFEWPSNSSCLASTGTYEESPYLSFLVNNTFSGDVVSLRAKHREYRFDNDAPSFSMCYRDSDGKLLEDRILLQTALTMRNEPNVEKVCVNGRVATPEVLAPLAVAMVALDNYAIYISRPRVYSM